MTSHSGNDREGNSSVRIDYFCSRLGLLAKSEVIINCVCLCVSVFLIVDYFLYN